MDSIRDHKNINDFFIILFIKSWMVLRLSQKIRFPRNADFLTFPSLQ